MLEVRLLGQFDVRRDGSPVVIPSRAAQSLFANLVLTAGTAHRRERLAGLLWPDTTDENARKNLRHELWRLRKAIETLSLYQGELLPGLYDDWVVLERERVRGIFEQKMARLLGLLVEEKRWQDILAWGERWISLGQTPEQAYRALMLAHNANGNVSQVASIKSLRVWRIVFDSCAEATGPRWRAIRPCAQQSNEVMICWWNLSRPYFASFPSSFSTHTTRIGHSGRLD